MAKIIVGIVSHGHLGYIHSNLALVEIAQLDNVSVVIKDNIKDYRLKLYADEVGYTYITTNDNMGFGENNNFIANFALENLEVSKGDWFIILNPDVEMSLFEFNKLIDQLKLQSGQFFAPNLFKDSEFKTTENSIRKFASYLDLFNPFKLQPINKPYDKNDLTDLDVVEWASGAFLCVTFAAFESVAGFDEKYFMYYEDVDLCYRLNQKGIKLRFLKNVKAVHKGEYKNRSIFSRHFRWYLNSLFKFLKMQSHNGH
ncbi:glycosyltransferase family 2 protein [Pseudoalteromonas sp. NZS11_1]|uniref:glycosyltransferase family 2 protein n=1 Tax=Pseudoalteromonas sp. NZS11_1 TaxID=2792070 RepID=UPI0018CC9628|nr:glycosyltransferase family 2 protein [Pseudoalteromonas sp. NZS11_1]MBH0044858.1 glycosyltransferase family 2 protein [Pseudoalteromonas sp. NZS11_1]